MPNSLQIMNKYKFFIIILVIISLVCSYIFVVVKPIEYDTSISFSINRINRQETTEYQYDGYYSIQASDLFSQTVMSWFMTSSVLLEIYDNAKVDPKITSIEKFTSRFKTKKYSAQNIVVRFKERDRETAEKISNSIIKIIEDKSAKANQTSDQKALFEVIGAKPVIVEQRSNLWFTLLLGFIAGLVVSIILIYIFEYFREEKINKVNNV